MIIRSRSREIFIHIHNELERVDNNRNIIIVIILKTINNIMFRTIKL